MQSPGVSPGAISGWRRTESAGNSLSVALVLVAYFVLERKGVAFCIFAYRTQDTIWIMRD